jgi:hypothetical protein
VSEQVQALARISDGEFGQFRRFIFEAAGITLAESKKALVSGRLAKRLQVCKVKSYGEYFKLLMSGSSPELQVAIDLLTTKRISSASPNTSGFSRTRSGPAGCAAARRASGALPDRPARRPTASQCYSRIC